MFHKRIPLQERFERLVSHEPNTGCHLWCGSTVPSGHGIIAAPGGSPAVPLRAHRVAWELYRGQIPAGAWVLHNCPFGDEPSCVNPDHLFLGDVADNQRDMALKGRGRKGALPYGVAKGRKGFWVRVGDRGGARYLGTYSTVEEAADVAAAARVSYLESIAVARSSRKRGTPPGRVG